MCVGRPPPHKAINFPCLALLAWKPSCSGSDMTSRTAPRPPCAFSCLRRPAHVSRAAPPSSPPPAPGSVTVVSLGPGGAGLLTVEARDALLAAPLVRTRTSTHPTPATLRLQSVASFDSLYETAGELRDVYPQIAAALVAAAQTGEAVVYAVPGDACVAEQSVVLLRAACATSSVPFTVLPGVSFIEPSLAALGLDALDASLHIADALDVASSCFPPFGCDAPALLAQLHSRAVASDVKLSLLAAYPPMHAVALVRAAGDVAQPYGTMPQTAVEWLPLHALDRGEQLCSRTSLYVPPLRGGSSFEGVCGALAEQRDALTGPWADADPDAASAADSLAAAARDAVAAAAEGDAEDGGAALKRALSDAVAALALACLIAEADGLFLPGEVMAAARAAAAGAGAGSGEAGTGERAGAGRGAHSAPTGRGYAIDDGDDDDAGE